MTNVHSGCKPQFGLHDSVEVMSVGLTSRFVALFGSVPEPRNRQQSRTPAHPSLNRPPDKPRSLHECGRHVP